MGVCRHGRRLCSLRCCRSRPYLKVGRRRNRRWYGERPLTGHVEALRYSATPATKSPWPTVCLFRMRPVAHHACDHDVGVGADQGRPTDQIGWRGVGVTLMRQRHMVGDCDVAGALGVSDMAGDTLVIVWISTTRWVGRTWRVHRISRCGTGRWSCRFRYRSRNGPLLTSIPHIRMVWYRGEHRHTCAAAAGCPRSVGGRTTCLRHAHGRLGQALSSPASPTACSDGSCLKNDRCGSPASLPRQAPFPLH